MRPGRSIAVPSLACWLAGMSLTAGCRLPSPEPRPNVEIGPCAERLHDLCGHLLMYYSVHKKLPPSLKELAGTAGLAPAPYVCPVSNLPYVYNPVGLSVGRRQGRLVLYDPEPVHSGMRWGILVRTSAEAGLITANVILVSEKEMASAGEGPRPSPGTDP